MYNILMDEALHTAVLILHVIGAMVVTGVAFVTLIVEIKKYTSKQVLELIELIWKVVSIALGVQLLTGVYLAVSEWDTIGKSPYFWIKMVLFFVVGTLVGVINRRRFKEMKKENSDGGTGGVTWALIGLLTFVAIAALGVLIAES